MRTHAPPEKNEAAPGRNGPGTNERHRNEWHNAGRSANENRTKAHDYVCIFFKPPPPRGDGLNDTIYLAACRSACRGTNLEDTVRELTELYGREARRGEVQEQTEKAFWWFKTKGKSSAPGPKFPDKDPAKILELARRKPRTVADIVRASPQPPPAGSPLDILERLMRLKEDDLLYIGPGPLVMGDTKTVTEWRLFNLRPYEMVVPNPMRAPRGRNKKGDESIRCNDNACRPEDMRLCVIEPDITEDLAAACGASPADVCATILLEMVFSRFPSRVRAVVDSGGKSLHLWFDIAGASRSDVIDYFKQLTPFGIDDAGTRPAQQFRLPGGFRAQTGRTQSVLYWNP